MKDIILWFVISVIVLTALIRPFVTKYISARKPNPDSTSSDLRWSYLKPTLAYVAINVNFFMFMFFTTWSSAIRLDVSLFDALSAVSDRMTIHLIVSAALFWVIYVGYMLVAMAGNGHIKNKSLRNIAINW